MRLLAAALLAAAVALPAPALADSVVICTETANVSWETNWDTVTVEAAIVEVPGCADGETVGLQLLTPAGDLPDEPLFDVVTDEHVRFDLSALDVRIEPVTGVRVLLAGRTIVETVSIEVEQRFFSSSGNEQRGLLRTTVLEVEVGGQYTVPGAPTRYEVVDCDTVRWQEPDDLIGQGAGTFTATSAGRHVVCYQQLPGTSGGPPDVEDPTVDETGVLGEQIERPAPGGAGGGLLSSTGANILGMGLAGLAMVLVGRRMRRWSPTRR